MTLTIFTLIASMVVVSIVDAGGETKAALGIDLGTEYVRSVAFNSGSPRQFEVVEDADGEQRLSTAVGSNAGERLVGSDALHYGRKKPERVCRCVARVARRC